MPDSQPSTDGSGIARFDWKWTIEKLTLPIVLALITIVFQWSANERSQSEIKAADQRAEAESRKKLYSELLHKREDADTALRRAVFEKLMDRYLQQDLDSKLVTLELLALNFHDSVDLSPLFWQLDRQIANQGKGDITLREHLLRISENVKQRQFAYLVRDAASEAQAIELSAVPHIYLPGLGCQPAEAALAARPGRLEFPSSYVAADVHGNEVPHRRSFTVEVECRDPLQARLQVAVVDVRTMHRWVFWLDPYDFPLSANTLLSRDERFALLLDRYDDGYGYAWLRLAYFPAARSGARDKPHVADVMSRLSQLSTEPVPAAETPHAGSAAVAPAPR